MNKILIALVLAVVMSGNVYAKSKKDEGLHYTCDYTSLHVYKTADSLVKWIDITGNINEELFTTKSEPFYYRLLSKTTGDVYRGGGLRRQEFEINRKTLRVYQYEYLSNSSLTQPMEFSEMGKTPAKNSCYVDELQAVEKNLNEVAGKVRTAYEKSIKY